jgi:hypothetical protein
MYAARMSSIHGEQSVLTFFDHQMDPGLLAGTCVTSRDRRATVVTVV